MAYFSLPESSHHDLVEGLYDASCVIKTIQAFCVGAENPFEGFSSTSQDEVHGLSVIFGCVTHAIDTAKEEILADRAAKRESDHISHFTADDLNAAVQQERERTIKMFETLKAAFSSTPQGEEQLSSATPEALSAREVAIMEAVRKGYGVEDIAQAVNLKKAAVQRIISKLRTTGDLPADTEKTDRAASA